MTETFSIIPGQIRMVWMALPVAVMIVALGGLFFSFAGARTAKFEVSAAGLRLRGDFYGRLIPANAIRLDAARAVNLRNEPTLTPVVRTVGTAIGGYKAGWFRLRDGEKALLYVTDPTHVAYVPTANGYAVLLSVANPDALLAALRNAIGPS